jgi:hypothetical protein
MKFVEQHKSIIELKQDLAELSIKIKQLKTSPEFQNPIPNIKLQTEVWSLEEKYKNVENKIKKIESKTYEKEYLIKTGKILNQYYKLFQKNVKNTLFIKKDLLNLMKIFLIGFI